MSADQERTTELVSVQVHNETKVAVPMSALVGERSTALRHCGVAMLVCSGLPQPSLAEFLR